MLEKIQRLQFVPQTDRHRLFATGGFKFFVQHFWEVLHSTPLLDAPYVDGICLHLEKILDLKRLVIRKPRRVGCSMLTSVMFVAYWLGAIDNTAKFVCASYSKDLAKKFNILTRKLIESEEYKFCFSHRVQLDIANESELILRSGGARFTASVESATLGNGGNIIILDDINTMNATEGELEQARKYYDDVLFRSLDSGKPSAVVNVQQTTHVDCLANVLLRRNKQIADDGGTPWHDLCLPFDASSDERMHKCDLWTDTRRPGEPIAPEGLFEKDYLVNARADRFEWEKQSNQNCIAGDGVWVSKVPHYTMHNGIIKLENGETIEPAMCGRYAVSDMALRTDNCHDYSVWQLWLAFDRHLICLVNDRVKLEWKDLKVHWLQLYRTHQPSFLVVEANGPQLMAAEELSHPSLGMTIERYNPGRQPKWDRAHTARVMIDNGNMWFPKDPDLTKELLNFSPNAKHDDMVDCCSQAALYGKRVMKQRPLTDEELEARKLQRQEQEIAWYQKKVKEQLFGKRLVR